MENEVIQTAEVPQETPAVAPQAAPQPEQTAAPEGEQKQAPEKTLTQTEVDAIIQREKAKAEARAERRALKAYRETLQQFAPQRQPAPADDKPNAAHFSTTEDYVEALTDWKLQQRDRQTLQQQARQEERTLAQKANSLYEQASKFSGFDADSFESLMQEHGTQAIAHALAESDKPGELMTWMVQHPEDVERISRLSPIRQAAEIGRMEAKLSTPKPVKELPPPIKTVSGAGSVSNGDPSKMSMDEYMAMRKKQGATWAK